MEQPPKLAPCHAADREPGQKREFKKAHHASPQCRQSVRGIREVRKQRRTAGGDREALKSAAEKKYAGPGQ
jgi:hypothetical protein